MDYAIELSNVTKKYSEFTLNNIDLKVPCGCIMGFVGENGAGKSTTIKLMLDLIKKDGGTIKILGKDSTQLSNSDKEKIGFVMDNCCFPEVMNATEVGKFSSKIYKNWDFKLYYDYLKRFDISLKKKIKEYSKGMKMKLTIACALSHNPSLLILDEATTGLDPIIRDEILDIFLEFMQDETHSIFMSSHITSDLEKVCDYITLIHKGNLIFSVEKDDLLESHGIVKCSEQELHQLPSKAVVRYRKNQFGVEALVNKKYITKQLLMDSASIEDIMLFSIRGMKL
ncbi:MAG: ABC transporter ATP-binding protein [Clostridiales bacterium]|nr:ABC transporter ATP-binding protein [Clostridiales bacterium]